MADEYLSGDVRTKLRTAQLAAERTRGLAVNAEALLKAQPKIWARRKLMCVWEPHMACPGDYPEILAETFQIPYAALHQREVLIASAL